MTEEERARCVPFLRLLTEVLDTSEDPSLLLDAMFGYAVGRMLSEGSSDDDVRVLLEESLAALPMRPTLVPGGSA